MMRVFRNFVQELEASQDRASLQAAMSHMASALGLRCFAYLQTPRNNREAAGLISDYPPDWTDHYLKQHYERLDPVIARAHMREEPFEWGLGADNRRLSTAQAQFFDEAAEFGIRCGLTIPLHDGLGPTAAITFASDERGRPFRKTVTRHRKALELMAANLHAHVRHKLYPDAKLRGVHFSPRERECLYWLSQGKSARDIGQILKIAERTVVFHIENVKHKLGVRTTCQALAILGRRNV
jgi:DNA-binding CsgD family transcriptional regulator